jgi:hypothetical protein
MESRLQPVRHPSSSDLEKKKSFCLHPHTMKRLSTFASRLLLVLTLATLTHLPPTRAAHNKAVIRAIHNGSAEFSNDKGKTWKKAVVGAVLAANCAVRTDANATLDIFLGENGPAVHLTKSTTLDIDKLDVENTAMEKVIETQLDLKQGRIYGNVKKMAAASKYEIKFQTGVLGIRGTGYALSADGHLQIFSGTAFVVYTETQFLDMQGTVQANQQSILTPEGMMQISAIPADDPWRAEFIQTIIAPAPAITDPFTTSTTCECGFEPYRDLEVPNLQFPPPSFRRTF